MALAQRLIGQQRIKQAAVCFFLLITSLAVYLQVKEFDFIYYDDGAYVFENQNVINGWTIDGLKWAFTAQHSRHWHPLTWLSHMTDCEFFGLNAGWHHLSNLLFHLTNTLLVYFLFQKMTGSTGKSAVVAALFSLHPLHVETVAWISDRKDLLCTFFWLLTMWAYVSYSKRPGIIRYLSVFTFFILALLSKSMAVTLPFILLLMDHWPLRRFQGGGKRLFRLLAEKAGLFFIGGVGLFIAVVSMYVSKVPQLWMISTNKDLIAKALVSYPIYIYKMVWPFDLIVPYPDLGIIPFWQAAGAAIFLIVTSFVVFQSRRKHPYLLFGWLWYIITLLPVVGLTHGSPQGIADRYTYIPLIGLFVIVVWGIPNLMIKLPGRQTALAALAGLVVSALTIISSIQVGYWRDSFSLLEHALAINPQNYHAMRGLGNILLEENDLHGASAYYYQAIAVNPDFGKAHTNLGSVMRRLGKKDQAIFHYSEAIRLDQGDWKAHYNFGNFLVEYGNIKSAIFHYRETLRLYRDYSKAHNNLGVALIRQGEIEAAISHYLEAVRIEPDFAEAYFNLGRAMAEKGDLERAKEFYTSAIEARPDYTKAMTELDILNQGTGNEIPRPESTGEDLIQ